MHPAKTLARCYRRRSADPEIGPARQIDAGNLGIRGKARDVLRDCHAPGALCQIGRNSRLDGGEGQCPPQMVSLEANDVEAVARLDWRAGDLARLEPQQCLLELGRSAAGGELA